MLRQIIHDGLVDEAYVAERTVGWEEVRRRSSRTRRRWPSGSPACPRRADRRGGAARTGGPNRSLIMHARGIEHSTHGVNNCLACINLALARGQVGKPGGGTMMITGQGNGQGGREVGQKANQLPGYRHIDVPEDREYVAEVWGIPVSEMPWEGAAATEMVHLMAEGEIKSCLVICSNLMVSLPDNAVVQRALAEPRPARRDRLLPVGDRRAGRRRPARLGLVRGRGHDHQPRRAGRQDQPAPRTRPARRARDWKIVCELARRLGRGAVLRLPARARDLGRAAPRLEGRQSPTTPASPGRRSTPRAASSGPVPPKITRARRACSPSASPTRTARRACPRSSTRRRPRSRATTIPFRLTTGRVVYHYLSGTQTRRLGFLNSQAPEPWVEIHPEAAARLGIENERPRARPHAARLDGAARRWSCRRSARTRCSSRSTTAIGRRSTSSPTRRSTRR